MTTSESDILGKIHDLIETEHQLRNGTESDEDRVQLSRIEEALDQCWDLLRQRRARQEFGQDADEATARPTSTVENYLQ